MMAMRAPRTDTLFVAPPLDTEDHKIFHCLCAAQFNGFGFHVFDMCKIGFGLHVFDERPNGTICIAYLGHPENRDHDNETKEWCEDLKITAPDVLKVSQWTCDVDLHRHQQMGTDYSVTISHTLYDRIPDILQYALDHGFNVLPTYRVALWGGAYKPGEKFIPEQMESRFIEKFRKLETTRKEYILNKNWPFFGEWNWVSSEGKKFCQEIRREWPEYLRCADDEDSNFYKRPYVQETAERYGLLQYAAWWPKAQEPMITDNGDTVGPD